MTATGYNTDDVKADVRALRKIGWLMGGVTALCTVMAIATGYFMPGRARDTFNHHAATRPAATATVTPVAKAQVTRVQTTFRTGNSG